MMTQAFYTGISGIRSDQYAIDIVSDNIANLSTVGFRGAEYEFASLFEENLNTTSSSITSSVGVGSRLQATTSKMSEGVLETTDRSTDLALLGEGWFGIQSTGRPVYTRDGAFNFDANNNLVSNDGFHVLGTMTGNIDGEVLTNDIEETILGDVTAQEKLSFPNELYYPPVATTTATFSGNLTSNYEKDPLNLIVTSTAIVAGSAVAGDVVFTPTATDEDGGVISYSIDNTTHYVVDAATGEVTLTEAGANAANVGSVAAGDVPYSHLINNPTHYVIDDTTGEVTLTEAGAIAYVIDDTTGVFTYTEAGATAVNESINNVLPIYTLTATSTSGSESTKNFPEDLTPKIFAISSKVINDEGVINSLRLQFTQSYPQTPPGLQWDVVATIKNLDGTETYATEEGKVSFDETGGLATNTLTSIDNEGNAVEIDLGSDFDGVISNSGPFTSSSASNGKIAGDLLGYSINKNAEVVATFTNGEQSSVGKVAVYHFQNDKGLHRLNGSKFEESSNSGRPIFYQDSDGNNITGTGVANHRLEGSNIDMTYGLTELIVLQRSYDANSKSISTADQMMQKALNMDA